MSDHLAATLVPTWDCNIPSNINDSDLSPEMKVLPVAQLVPTESLFVVIRSKLGDYARKSRFYLDLINPALKHLTTVKGEGSEDVSEVDAMEREIEEQFISYCDPENPLQLAVIWWGRYFIQRYRLLEYLTKIPHANADQVDDLRDRGSFYAIRMIEKDTLLVRSPALRRFVWMFTFYFPFPAYMQLLKEIKHRPTCRYADEAFQVLSENFEARKGWMLTLKYAPIFKVFAKTITQAWEAREAVLGLSGSLGATPSIVVGIQETLDFITQEELLSSMQQTALSPDLELDDAPVPAQMSMPMSPPNVAMDNMNPLAWPPQIWGFEDLFAG